MGPSRKTSTSDFPWWLVVLGLAAAYAFGQTLTSEVHAQVLAVLDARMQEVYIASFKLDEQGIMQPADEEQLLSYSEAEQAVKFTLIGSGSDLVKPEQLQYKAVSATAQDIAAIARAHAQQRDWVAAEYALPVYLRDNAWKKIPEQGKP